MDTKSKQSRFGPKPAKASRASNVRASAAPTPSSADAADSFEDRISELARSGKLFNAAREAVEEQKKSGLPVTFRRGNQVIKQYADGREEVLAEIPPSKFKIPAGVEIIPSK